jgi:hypothetical protein
MPLAALCRRHSSADFTTNMSEFDFRQAQRRFPPQRFAGFVLQRQLRQILSTEAKDIGNEPADSGVYGILVQLRLRCRAVMPGFE